MHKYLFLLFSVLTCISSQAQSGEDIIAELKAINKTTANKSCNAGNAAAISNRAMNVFLADKTGYLSQSTDLSLYTNYVTLNTIEGQLTVNHNFQKATGIDKPIKKLLSVGISTNVANEIAPAMLDKKQENDLGMMLSYKWLGKVKTQFADCAHPGKSGNQKQLMDALRAAMLYALEAEINTKVMACKIAFETMDTTDIPGQNRDTAKAVMLRNLHAAIKEEYAEKFAKQQAALLTQTNNFKSISTSWTSFTSYIPIVSPAYTVAPSLTTPFQKKHSYPMNVMLSHTRLWESTKTGRWLLTVSGKALLNNSKGGYLLNKIQWNDYKNGGGTDTMHLPDLKNDKLYLGQYKTFVTPSLNGRLVYFPPGASHVGISVTLEKNFGRYHTLNTKLGIPVVLINPNKFPAVNFEFFVLLFDMNHSISTEGKYGNRNIVGVNVGIPMSRLMF